VNSIIYLYRDLNDAETGARPGASGFLVAMDSEVMGSRQHVYAVTNAHVIEDGFPMLRVNLKHPSSQFERTFSFPFEIDSWVTHPTHDLAVRPIPADAPLSTFKVSLIGLREFLGERAIEAGTIALGDDLFYVGRFVDHAGKWENQPSVRFGNVSMLPNELEPLEYEVSGQRRKQIGFLVEARSRSGYSGSPVFMFQPEANRPALDWAFEPPLSVGHSQLVGMNPKVSVVGVDWGHLNEEVELRDGVSNRVLPSKAMVHAGMMGVVPIWYLREFLETAPRLIEQRRRDDEYFSDTARATGSPDSGF
jgi:hypothetical protein